MSDLPVTVNIAEKTDVGHAAARGALFGAIAFPILGRAFDVLGWSSPRLWDIPGTANKLRFVASEAAIGAIINAAVSTSVAILHNLHAKKAHKATVTIEVPAQSISR